MVVERKLEKISEQKFVLKIYDKDNDHKSEKGYKRTELRDTYRQLDMQKQQLMMQKMQAEKQLGKFTGITETDELKHLLKMLDLAKKLEEKNKLVEQLEAMKKDGEMLTKQLKEISAAVPEVLRELKK